MFWGNFIKRYAPAAYLLLIVFYMLWSSVMTYIQYRTWQTIAIGQYLLPPYAPLSYFLQYSFFRFWSHFIVALIFSMIILIVAKYFNSKHGGQYFYDEEPYLLAIAILVVGYPGWLVYFVLMLAVPLLWSSFLFLLRHCERSAAISTRLPRPLRGLAMTIGDRISYRHLWLPLAAVAIIISMYLQNFEFWSKLII